MAALDNIAALERRLKPFGRLPDELIAIIFQFVQQDWERLPSPFQLSHVCSRWKRLAESTPSLWQDLRILRVWDRAYTEESQFFPPIKSIYRFTETEVVGDYTCTRQDGNQLDLLRLCAQRSRHSLTHFELDVWEWEQDSEFLPSLISIASASCRSLQSATFIQANVKQRQRYTRRLNNGVASGFAAFSLNIVMHSPKLSDVELYVGELLQGSDDIPDYTHTAEEVAPTPSLRRLHLDCFAGLTHAKGTAVRENFLTRASQLRSLSLRNVPSVDMAGVDSARFPPLVLQLLKTCAETLADLEADGEGNILAGAQAIGVTSFPRLRRYRHVRRRSLSPTARTRARDMERLALPRLETVEGPADVVTKLPKAPLMDIVLHVDGYYTSESACAQFSQWLLQLSDGCSPRSLTILETTEQAYQHHVHKILDVLTPSCAGRVACAKLQKLRLVARPAYSPNDAGYTPSLDPAPLPPDRRHQEVSSVPRLMRIAQERERISQGLPPREGDSRDGGAVVWKRCEALTIELEGWVFPEEN